MAGKGSRVNSGLIVKARNEAGLTQEELAKESCLTANTVLKAEKGGPVSFRTIKLLCDALKIQTKDVIVTSTTCKFTDKSDEKSSTLKTTTVKILFEDLGGSDSAEKLIEKLKSLCFLDEEELRIIDAEIGSVHLQVEMSQVLKSVLEVVCEINKRGEFVVSDAVLNSLDQLDDEETKKIRSDVESIPTNDGLKQRRDQSREPANHLVEVHSDEGNFAQLMVRVKEGAAEAIRDLVEAYGRYVMIAVRKHLSDKIRSQYNSVDFMQAVWGSFFRLERCPDFKNPTQLIAYLVTVAKSEVIEECQKRLNNQGPDEDLEQQKAEIGHTEQRSREKRNRKNRIPTPSAVATAREEWEKLLAKQPDVLGQILRMRAEGANIDTIAEALGLNTRHVQRVVKRYESWMM